MVELIRLQETDTPEYLFVEKLLTEAFPEEERRDLPDFHTLTRCEGRFYNNVITDNDSPIGLVTYWDLERFLYIEHFAILPALRNGGYGHRVLELLKNRLRRPIVLEAEPPTEELARRRIAFYCRQGFILWQSPYLQPPYRNSDTPFPLCLMVCGNLNEATDFAYVRQTIHQTVYGST